MNTLLTDKEREITRTLFHRKQATIGQLARETTINRTSLYPILQRLVEKGVVTTYTHDGVAVFSAISELEMHEWLKRRQDEISQETQSLETWIRQLPQAPSPSLLSKITYYEGFEGISQLYADTWRNNQEKVIYAITDVRAAVETAGNFFRTEYMPQRVAHGVYIKDIMTKSAQADEEISRNNNQLREIRVAQDLFENLGVEINIYDNTVSFVAYDTQKPSGVRIENETIASAMKHIFTFIWKSAS